MARSHLHAEHLTALDALSSSRSLCARLLGPVQLATNERPLTSAAWPRRSARSLLLLLLATPGHRVTRDRAVDLLWPDLPLERVPSTWYQALTTLRRVLEPGLAPRQKSAYLVTEAAVVSLDPRLELSLDVDAFEATLRRCDARGADERRACLQSALALYQGDLLAEEPGEGWTADRREELHLAWQRAILALADLDLHAGEPLRSVTALQRVLATDRTAEEMHRALIRAFVSAGEQDSARRQYERCRQALWDELGIEPDDATRRLVAMDEGSAASVPSAVPTDPIATPWRRLPNPATSLIGRAREIALTDDLLWRTGARLVTLTGPGGIGKTRLAIEIAEHRELEGVAVAFVPLDGVSAPDLVLPTVGQALGVRHDGGSYLAAVLRHIGEQELLLILDNFEHVISAADIVARFLADCPRLTILSTSRVPLRLGAEQVVVLPPLGVPRARQPTFAALARSEAVTLFVQRARAADAEFSLTEENAPAIGRLCAQLDGLPLAIELAAARVRVLSPRALLARLDQRLNLLDGGARDAPVRLRTMRQAIGWSYELLTPEEQALFRKLAVFSGGFTLAAAEYVGRDGFASVLDLVSSLVDNSLMRLAEETDLEPRFVMLGTIREYGLEQLTAHGERNAVQRRHADHFVSFAEEANRRLKGRDQIMHLALLEAEHDNLRAALTWSLEEPERGDLALRLVGALHWFWYLRDHYGEGRRWLEAVLARGVPATPSPTRVVALAALGNLAIHPFRDYPAARAWLEQSVTLGRELGDPAALAYALHVLGWAELLQPGHGEARSATEESVALFRQVGDRWGLATALCTLGMALIVEQDSDAANAALAESLVLSRELGEIWSLARALHYSGEVARFRREDEEARIFYEESLMLYRTLGHRGAAAIVLHNLGYVAQHQGNMRQAMACFAEALAEHIILRDQQNIGHCLRGIAGTAALLGQPEQTARLFGAADAHFERIGTAIWPVDKADSERNLEAARATLGEETFAAAFAAGRALSLQDAIAEARGVAASIGSVRAL